MQHILNFPHNGQLSKCLHYQICLMAHAIYIDHEWNILIFWLYYNPNSNTMKHIDPITPNYVTTFETIVSQIKPPYKTMASTKILFRLFKMSPSTTITRITTKELTLWIFHHICMDENPRLLIHGCNFITKKGNKSNNLKQILGLVQH